jgi:hypothetical protein
MTKNVASMTGIVTHSESSNPLGFSGGGWLIGVNDAATPAIIGLSSNVGEPSVRGKFALEGPLFDTCTMHLLDFVKAECGR